MNQAMKISHSQQERITSNEAQKGLKMSQGQKKKPVGGLVGLERHLKKKSIGSNLRKKKSQSVIQFYKEICSKLSCTMNTAISHGLKGGELSLNIDNLLPSDVNVLRVLLRECEFTSVTLQGNKEFDAQAFHDRHEQYTKNYQNDNGRASSASLNEQKSRNLRSEGPGSSSGRAGSKKQKKNFSADHVSDFLQVMQSVGVNIGKNQTLQIVRISNVDLTAQSLSCVCVGLQKSKSVKELYIQNCNLSTTAIESGMLQYMKDITSLVLLDLSFNQLDGQSGGLIGKLLSGHARNRDEHIWLCGLRGEVPENDINLEGICEVNLMGNFLNDASVTDLCYFLRNDGWTRSINLRFNQICASGLIELNAMLDNNENLISLDIRDNPGMTPSKGDLERYGEEVKLISKSIYDKLLRNIKTFKHKRDKMRKMQQEQMLANLQYQNNNMLPAQFIQQNNLQQEPSNADLQYIQQQQQQQAFLNNGLPHQLQNIQQNNPNIQLSNEQILYAQQQEHQMQLLQQQYALLSQNQGQQKQPLQIQQNIEENEEHEEGIEEGEEGEGDEEGREHDGQDEYQNMENGCNEGNEQYEEGDHQEEEHNPDEQEGEIELTEDQQYILSEEFLGIQQEHFQELYGQNDEFLSLTEEQQEAVFQEFLLSQQKEYLIELAKQQEGQGEMEGVDELQEEQQEEDHQEGEEGQHEDNPHDHEEDLHDANNPDENNEQINEDNLQDNHEVENNAVEDNQEEMNQTEAEEMEKVMEQLYEALKLDEIVDPNCQSCLALQHKLLHSEYQKLNLIIQIKNLQTQQEQQQLLSLSPNNCSPSGDIENMNQNILNSNQNNSNTMNNNSRNANNSRSNPNSNTNNNNEGAESEDMLNRIEGLMGELTRLMESLENAQQNNITNNITCQLSNTTNTNNQTYQLLNSNHNINFNNTFTNILGGSQNTSNILPRNQANNNTTNNSLLPNNIQIQQAIQQPQVLAMSNQAQPPTLPSAKKQKNNLQQYYQPQQNQLLLQQQQQQQQQYQQQLQFQQPILQQQALQQIQQQTASITNQIQQQQQFNRIPVRNQNGYTNNSR